MRAAISMRGAVGLSPGRMAAGFGQAAFLEMRQQCTAFAKHTGGDLRCALAVNIEALLDDETLDRL